MKKVKQIVKQTTSKKLAGANGSRTHHGYRRAPSNGFEVRGAHRNSLAPPELCLLL